MPPVTKEIVVAASTERVFAALTDPAQRAVWSTTFEEKPLAGPMGVGSRIEAKRRGSTSGSRYEMTVTAFEPGRKPAMTLIRNGTRVGNGAFELSPAPGGGTRVRSVSTLELSGMQRMMEPMLDAAAAKEMDAEPARLERHVEST